MIVPYAAGYQRTESGEIVPLIEVDGKLVPAAWAAMSPSQAAFLLSTETVTLFAGTRGCGKTAGLLVSFAQHVHCGLGPDWVGVILRRTYPELSQVILESKILFPKIFGNACVYNKMDHVWTWDTGEQLRFSYLLDDTELESQRFLGQQFGFIGMDELCSWPNVAPLQFMLSCLRSPNPKVPLMMRCTSNPWGPGRQGVVDFFHIDTSIAKQPRVGTAISEGGISRRVVNGSLWENPFLDDDYLSRVVSSTDDESKQRAHAFGTWSVPSDSLYQDLFARGREYIEVEPFHIPDPSRIRFSYDHGSLAPFSVLFFFEANGEELTTVSNKIIHTKPGDLFCIAEIYGGKKNIGLKLHVPEIAARIRNFVLARQWPESILRRENIADSACWQDDGRPSVAEDFLKAGINFVRANKGPGSRAQGVMQIRKWLSNAIPTDDGERVAPGLRIVKDCCPLLMQHLPFMERSRTDPETASQDQIDHDHEALQYFLTRTVEQRVWSGRVDGYRGAA